MNSFLSSSFSETPTIHQQRNSSSSNLIGSRSHTPPKRPAMLARKCSNSSQQNLLLKTSNQGQPNHLTPSDQMSINYHGYEETSNHNDVQRYTVELDPEECFSSSTVTSYKFSEIARDKGQNELKQDSNQPQFALKQRYQQQQKQPNTPRQQVSQQSFYEQNNANQIQQPEIQQPQYYQQLQQPNQEIQSSYAAFSIQQPNQYYQQQQQQHQQLQKPNPPQINVKEQFQYKQKSISTKNQEQNTQRGQSMQEFYQQPIVSPSMKRIDSKNNFNGSILTQNQERNKTNSSHTNGQKSLNYTYNQEDSNFSTIKQEFEDQKQENKQFSNHNNSIIPNNYEISKSPKADSILHFDRQQTPNRNTHSKSQLHSLYNQTPQHQISQEIEQLRAQLQDKNKQVLLLQEKCELIQKEFEKEICMLSQTIKNHESIIKGNEQKIVNFNEKSEKDKQLIQNLKTKVDHLTSQAHKDAMKQEANNGNMRERFDQLVKINEGLIIKNNQLQDEIQKLGLINEQSVKQNKQMTEKLLLVEKDNVQLLSQFQKMQKDLVKSQSSCSQLNNQKSDSQNAFLQEQEEFKKEKDRLNWIIQEKVQHITNFQKKVEQLQTLLSTQQKINQENKNAQKPQRMFEEEIEGMKYLVKEKVQEINFWKNKADNFKKEYEELEQRLQAQLKSNQTLNNRILSISSQMHNNPDNLDEGNSELNKKRDLLDRYTQANYLKVDSPTKSRYGLSPSTYQNRLQDFQNQPLKECTNQMSQRQLQQNH